MIALGLCANVAGQATIELMVKPPAAGDASHGAHEAERAALLASLDRRAGYFCAAFNKMDGTVSCNPAAEGALYLFPKVELPIHARSRRPTPRASRATRSHAEKLLDATGICIVPGSRAAASPARARGTGASRSCPTRRRSRGVVGKMEAFHKGFMLEYAAVQTAA